MLVGLAVGGLVGQFGFTSPCSTCRYIVMSLLARLVVETHWHLGHGWVVSGVQVVCDGVPICPHLLAFSRTCRLPTMAPSIKSRAGLIMHECVLLVSVIMLSSVGTPMAGVMR
jgi:hypothetical protein